MNKWIGAFLGAMANDFLGALAGFIIGAIFDKMDTSNKAQHTPYDDFKPQPDPAMENADRNGFLFTLMVLTAHIIQADGKIMHSEMELARQFLRNNFGEASVQQGNDILLRLFEYRKQKGEQYWQEQIERACIDISNRMPEEYRLQLIAFLADVAKADGSVPQSELDTLYSIAAHMGISSHVVDQMFSLGRDTLEDAYKALGITPDATDDEVRRAYKKMALKYHPDRVATLGNDVKEASQKKFQEINNAKERIFKARNL